MKRANKWLIAVVVVCLLINGLVFLATHRSSIGAVQEAVGRFSGPVLGWGLFAVVILVALGSLRHRPADPEEPMLGLKVITCPACKGEGAMRKASIAKHGAAGGCLGVALGLFAVLVVAGSLFSLNPIGIGFGVILFLVAALFGGNRKVWRCLDCGHILERG